MLLRYPTPSCITKFSEEDFIKVAWSVSARKVAKEAFLKDLYATAGSSIGVPINEDSQSTKMYRLILEEAISLCARRQGLEIQAHNFLKDDNQYKILRSITGIGPKFALTIIAESGDLKRFSHHRKYLNFCGMNLSTHQSGQLRGKSSLSKRGYSRLRCAFWMAAAVAIRMRENSFRYKYERYIKSNPNDADLKQNVLTATAAKICRVAYSLVKENKIYRPYFESSIPSGGIRSEVPRRLNVDLVDNDVILHLEFILV